MAKDVESKLYNRRRLLSEMQKRKLAELEPVVDTVPGVVFSIGGSIFADRGARYVWVHEWGALASQQQAYLPYGLSVFEGAGVIMQRSPRAPYQYEIIGLNTSPYPGTVAEDSDIGRAAIPNHGENHQYPTEATKGPDPVLIWHSAVQTFKAVATEVDMLVTVGPGVYYDGNERKWFPSQTVNLASYIPAAGNAVRVLLYLDTNIGFINISSSAEVAQPADPDYPTAPHEAIPSAYFYIEDTYTTLSMIDDYRDARPLIGGPSSVPFATAPGQQIFSDSDNVWQVGKIVTSGGAVVVSGGDVVWSPT